MADVNYYSGGRSRKIVAETIKLHNEAWVRIRILEGDREIGVISVFGADAITSIKSETDVAQAA